MKLTAYLIALALAAIGAAVSLYGLVLMFGVAFLPIGIGLEAGKLTAAAVLHHSWTALGRRIRYALTGIVVTLMVLTSSGIYGFTLTRYLAHVALITRPAAERIAAADEAVARQAGKVADLVKQIADIDAAAQPIAAGSTRRGTEKSLKASAINAQAAADAAAARQRLADDQRRQARRSELAGHRDAEAAELSRLRGVRAEAGSEQQAAEAEVGPVRVIADALGVDPGKVVAAAVASIYDPLCVLLLLAAGHRPAAPVQAVPAWTVVQTAAAAPAGKPARKSKRKVRAVRKRKPALAPDWRKPETANPENDNSNVVHLKK